MSIPFYQKAFGMTLVKRFDFDEAKFSLFFLGKLKEGEEVPADEDGRGKMAFEVRAGLAGARESHCDTLRERVV